MKLLVNLYIHLLFLVLTTVILTKCGDRNYPSINLLKKLKCTLVTNKTANHLQNCYFNFQGIPQNCFTVYNIYLFLEHIIRQLDQIIPLHNIAESDREHAIYQMVMQLCSTAKLKFGGGKALQL